MSPPTNEDNVTQTTTYTVTGMTCQHCASAVTEELTAIGGVREVRVDVPTGQVMVTSDGPLPAQSVRTAVTEAGYRLVAG